MKKSTRALASMLVLDALIAAGTAWFVMNIRSGATALTVPPAEAISTVTTIGGGAIGIVTGICWWRSSYTGSGGIELSLNRSQQGRDKQALQ